MTPYVRYHISTQPAPARAAHPSRFRVRVHRAKLASLLLKELIVYRAALPVVLSRPCVYGVFSGPIGGFAPREKLCVGCLRCTVQYPDMVQILPNPDRHLLGDEYFSPDQVDTVLYEAATGRVPVRGAGYRGAFAGKGWDGMWTDMSEIVRPTRDGIHGREFISTAVDLGHRPSWLTLDPSGAPVGEVPRSVSLPVPFVFDRPARSIASEPMYRSLVGAASAIQSRALVPLSWAAQHEELRHAVIPVVQPMDRALLLDLPVPAEMAELEDWSVPAARTLRSAMENSLLIIQLPFGSPLEEWIQDGFRIFHLTADYHGGTRIGFVMDAIRETHEALVRAGIREQVTLLGSGGMVAAEHLAKAIVVGLDAVALDTPLWVALQGRMVGPCLDRETAQVDLPDLDLPWAIQRLANLSAAWRDQLLEVLGAMGIRDVRRLRGEVGRAMFQPELEREAFAGIPGFEDDDAVIAA